MEPPYTFRDIARATSLLNAIDNKDFYIEKFEPADDVVTWHRIVTGPFDQPRDDFNEMVNALDKLIDEPVWVRNGSCEARIGE